MPGPEPVGAPTVLLVGASRAGKSLLERELQRRFCGIQRGFESDCFLEALTLTYPERMDETSRLSPHDLERIKDFRSHYAASLAQFGADASVFTSTRPGNVLYTGSALQSLPGCKVLLCRRHLLDNAIRIYFRHYETGNTYSYDLSRVIRHLNVVEQMLGHWSRRFPGRALSVDYETLAADPDDVMQRVGTFLELPPRSMTEFSELVTDDVGCWKRYRRELQLALGEELVAQYA